jgi:uncharacterized protein YggE
MKSNTTWGAAIAIGAVVGVVAVGSAALVLPDGGTSGAAPVPTTPPSTVPGTGGAALSARTVTVSGSGTVSVAPDTATIFVGVSVTADKAGDAMSSAADKASALIATLREHGVADTDVRTNDISLTPRYDDKYVHITGYVASNTVSVTLHDLGRTGAVLDSIAAKVGDATRINGITFSVEDDEKAVADARTRAVEDARRRAEQYTAAAGVTVGQVLRISEESLTLPQPFYRAADTAAGAAATPVMPGQQDVGANVTVVFELG